MKLSLKKIVAPPLPLTILILSVAYLLWILLYFSGVSFSADRSGSSLPAFAGNLFPEKSLWPYLISFLLTGVNSILILLLNNRYNIIRTRTLMPVFIFNFLMGVWFQTHMFAKAHMALTLILASFYLFFGMYRNPNASGEAFTGSFLIGLSCFLIKPLVVLLPVFWIGFMMFQSFSLRTWLASLFGFLNPLIFYFAASFYLNPEALTVENLLSGLIPSFVITQLSIYEIIYLLSMIVVILISAGGLFPNLRNDSIQTRSRLSFLSFFSVCMFLVSIFSAADYKAIMPIVAFGYSLIFSHPLSLRHGNFFSILLLVFLLLNVAYIVSSLIF